jgi:hypothetical protein
MTHPHVDPTASERLDRVGDTSLQRVLNARRPDQREVHLQLCDNSFNLQRTNKQTSERVNKNTNDKKRKQYALMVLTKEPASPSPHRRTVL